MILHRTTVSPASSVSVLRVAPVLGAMLIAATGSAHDEDWRKLVDRIGAIEGPIFRLDPEHAGPSNRGQGFDSVGITLLSQIPLNQFAGNHNFGNDCWGYTAPSGREYAIMGLERGFGFVEITNPADPAIVGVISGPQSDWHDVKVIGSYAYGVSEGGAGIQVMDMSQIDSGTVTLVRNWQAKRQRSLRKQKNKAKSAASDSL